MNLERCGCRQRDQIQPSVPRSRAAGRLSAWRSSRTTGRLVKRPRRARNLQPRRKRSAFSVGQPALGMARSFALGPTGQSVRGSAVGPAGTCKLSSSERARATTLRLIPGRFSEPPRPGLQQSWASHVAPSRALDNAYGCGEVVGRREVPAARYQSRVHQSEEGFAILHLQTRLAYSR